MQPHFIGFVGPQNLKRSIPNELQRDVFSSFGGGGDAVFQLKAVFECANNAPELRFVVCLGPNAHPESRKCAAYFLANGGLTNTLVVRFIHDIPHAIAQSHVYIGMSGYNTSMEVIASRTPCILLPRYASGEREQLVWAELLQQLGYSVGVHAGPPYDTKLLLNQIRSCINSKSPNLHSPIFSGARNLAKLIKMNFSVGNKGRNV